MFTFGLFYVCTYLLIIITLLVLSFVNVPVQIMTEYSVTFFMLFLQKYNNFKNIFFLLIFCLTGLPPVGLFFIKFNILTVVIYQTHIFTIISLFFFFFLNMLYYIQIFNIKNFKAHIYKTISPKFFLSWQVNLYSKSYISSYGTYNLMLSCVSLISLLFLFLFFFNELYFILSLMV